MDADFFTRRAQRKRAGFSKEIQSGPICAIRVKTKASNPNFSRRSRRYPRIIFSLSFRAQRGISASVKCNPLGYTRSERANCRCARYLAPRGMAKLSAHIYPRSSALSAEKRASAPSAATKSPRPFAENGRKIALAPGARAAPLFRNAKFSRKICRRHGRDQGQRLF
jgi:hypothetical protein